MKLCSLGFHCWDLVAIDTSFYSAPFLGSTKRTRHVVKFYQCTRCFSKKSKSDTTTHKGVRLAQDLWREKGLLYASSRLLTDVDELRKYDNAQLLSLIKGTKT